VQISVSTIILHLQDLLQHFIEFRRLFSVLILQINASFIDESVFFYFTMRTVQSYAFTAWYRISCSMLSTRSHGSRLNMIRPGYLSASYRFAQHSTFITVWNNFYYCLDFNTLEIASSFACGLLVHLTRTCLFFEVFRANCCNGFYHSSVRSANGSPGTLVLAHQGCSEI